jgi:hypothetical protein
MGNTGSQDQNLKEFREKNTNACASITTDNHNTGMLLVDASHNLYLAVFMKGQGFVCLKLDQNMSVNEIIDEIDGYAKYDAIGTGKTRTFVGFDSLGTGGPGLMETVTATDVLDVDTGPTAKELTAEQLVQFGRRKQKKRSMKKRKRLSIKKFMSKLDKAFPRV